MILWYCKVLLRPLQSYFCFLSPTHMFLVISRFGYKCVINPRRMCRRVTVVVLSVCLSITTKSAAHLVYALKSRCHRVLFGVFKVFVVWLSLKTLCSKVLASFANRHCLPHFLTKSRRTEETVMGSFKCKECVQLAIEPTTQLTLITDHSTLSRQASWLFFQALICAYVHVHEHITWNCCALRNCVQCAFLWLLLLHKITRAL